ncbi:MAG: acyltransferase [Oscillospiraceae bacterium]|nr:acyltransferase [Oscillospiraceae bacterium]
MLSLESAERESRPPAGFHRPGKGIKWFSTIRILGLLLVLVYHFFKDLLPGGFIGVDVFFTFSGYLITALIIEEFQKSGRFRIFAFYKRRFLRIFPPLLLSVLLCLPFALLISPDFTTGIVKQISAALGFSANYFEILTGGSYEAQLLPHLFIHTWSLAVEAHFYVLWGLFGTLSALIFGHIYKNRPKAAGSALKCFVFAGSVLLACFSWLGMQTAYDAASGDPSVAYMSTVTHGFPFFIGAAAGAVFGLGRPAKKVRKILRTKWFGTVSIAVMGFTIAALAMLARTLTFLDPTTYRYGFLAASLLTALMIFAARALHESTPGRVNEPKPLSALSSLSYCVYLFHWPLYIVFSAVIANNLVASGITFLLSLLFSSLVFYGIDPIIQRRCRLFNRENRKMRTIAFVLSLPLLFALVLGAVVIRRAPDVSSLELQLSTGYLYQDVDEIKRLKHMFEAVTNQPLVIPESLFPIGSLKKGTPESAVQAVIPQNPVIPAQKPSVTPNGLLVGVSVVGDSVCLGARKSLIDHIPNCAVDALGSRPLDAGYDVLMKWKQEGTLRETVIVALGTNRCVGWKTKIDQIIDDLPSGCRLIFVTPYDGRMTENWTSYHTVLYERLLPEQYPFVTVADWYEIISTQTHLMASDKIHIGGATEAIKVYTDMLIAAINEAAQKPAKEQEIQN